MLKLHIPERSFWHEDLEVFIYTKEKDIVLEHSLISLSKWEAKWKKPFLGRNEKTTEESIDYIRCMTVTPNVDNSVYFGITPDIMEQINKYIEDPMTATTFTEAEEAKARGMNRSGSFITSELIYYWMLSLNIPVEFEKWHLNRLLTLIKICNVKSQDPRKMSKGAVARQIHSLNAARRARMHSRG